MALKNRLTVFVCAALMAAGAACSGDAGPTGPAGPAGTQGEPGEPGTGGATDPSVSAVFPNRVFLSRSADISISGFGTHWTSAAQVDFGAGVVVNSLVVASSTAIVANVSVSDSATTGVRDVTVTDGAESVTYKGAFKVESALGFKIQGSPAQGSLLVVEGTMNDPTTPLDTFTTEITVSDGLTVFSPGIDSYSAKLIVGVNVDATPGAHEITVVSGYPTTYTYKYSFNVEARTATDLQSGVDALGTIANPFESALYKFTPTAGPQAVSFLTVSDNPDALPGFVLLPSSGNIGDFITYSDRADVFEQNSQPYYAIYWDDSGVAPQDFTLTATETTATIGMEAAQNNSAAQAQVIDPLPFVLQKASISADNDEDWFSFTATANDLSRCVHVVTYPVAGDMQAYPTDTYVDVYKSDGTTSLGGPSDDFGYHEDFISAPITAETKYYVKIYASPYYLAANTEYDALINIVDCPPKDP